MTGLLDRLLTWLGSLFGGGTTDADDAPESASTPPSEQPAPRVVHRDDRPLETPSTMDRTDPPAPESRAGGETSVDIPDAEADVDSPGREADSPADCGRVSIPDAEETGDVTPTPDERAASTTDGAADTPAEPTTPETAEDRNDSADAAFACSVCGTAVDDPTEPCPLCRSTDVVPAGDADDAEAPTRDGRTAVSATDDEAVDRLRDVRDDG